MNDNPVQPVSYASPQSGPPLPLREMAGFITAIVMVLLIAVFSYQSLLTRATAGDRVTFTLTVIEQLQALLSEFKDAETGQRGYLLTGEERYLEPHTYAKAAIATDLGRLRQMVADRPRQLDRLATLEQLGKVKLDEIDETIQLRRAGNGTGALAVVLTDRGKAAMEQIRQLAAAMIADERQLLVEQQADWQSAVVASFVVAGGGSAILIALIAAAAVLASRTHRARQTQNWLRAGLADLSGRLQGEQRLDKLGDTLLGFLAQTLDAQVGALYVAQPGGWYQRVAAVAADGTAHRERVAAGEGLLGQAAKENRALRVRDVPANYLPVSSALGSADARELLVAPAAADGVVQAVIELGFFRRIRPADQDMMGRISELVGIAVRSSKDRTQLEDLLEETQRQAEELQTQQEELRVNNEELEEQSRALRESQGQLELQQAELEQTNSSLEEQTQLLEDQRDNLARAQISLQAKADELAQANHYKSEFLANMSHELRTPLNSTLILAKLLADNKGGNLTAEQVKFAQTISSAGNDLLTLINDILDLSKIEAGKVDIDVQPVALARLLADLQRAMEPVAQQKGLVLRSGIDDGVPLQIHTDLQRLNQMLKNLLSNALKFTDRGEVSLRAFKGHGETVVFAVRDTGIGIAADQQDLIFEAFRQADGSTHRKYGGTGLGLSISRDLARLLGGSIDVQSVPGEGSVFSLTLPVTYVQQPGLAADAEPPPRAAVPAAAPAGRLPGEPATAAAPVPAASMPAPPPGGLDDDRDQLRPNARLILIVEDDLRFAGILRDLAHEMDFQCVIAHTGADGLAAAVRFQPSAILLDIHLPDHSGLGVLDQLKRNARTRHIPVHVLSVGDYTQQALELGAAGYDLKPVKRAQLVAALQGLEAKFSQRLRRVLVVEDDARQRESIRDLLADSGVEITAVETAADALAQLAAVQFDCMIMDMRLPDLSGQQLLEKMVEQNQAACPPVIVYTGQSLTRAQEQDLRRFSKSIIIKDARSPERLVDEVTLFLHQVESSLPQEIQRMIKVARDRDAALDGRHVLIVEDDVRNIFALTSVLEPKGAKVQIARNGIEALQALDNSRQPPGTPVELVLMDIMMPLMDGMTAMREIRKKPEWKKLPIIALTAKAMKDDQEKCLAAGANDYIAKPLDVERLLSLVRVWMPK